MLFSEEDAPELKKWIVKRLENTSDADADVLADYVLALLRHDGDVATVRRLCEDEIPDFLKEDSSVFVQDVFDAIQYRSYLPGAPAPPHAPSNTADMYGGPGMPGAPIGPHGSRKRSFNERGDGDAQDRGFQQTGADARAFKQARRGGATGRGGYSEYGVGRGGHGGRPQPMNFQGGPRQSGYPNIPAMPSPPPGMPALDPNNPMAAIMAMQAMGFPVPGFSPPGNAGSPPPVKKQRCRDYDTKGFCARGNTCMFEHGNDSIYVPPGQKRDEYDPSNAQLLPDANYQLDSRSDNLGVEASPMYGLSERGQMRGRGRGGQRGDRGGRRGGRAEFSSDRPNHDKNNTTIVVEQIPEEKFSEDAVREFFSEFGTISEISMQAYKRLALVKFDDWNTAQAAYRSPKVIFDNRFVKVYWYKDPDSLPQPPAGSSNGPIKNANGTSIPTPARETSEPQIDLEEFARKQQEVQKAHEEKQKKKQEMEAARKELEKRQEELLKNQAEEKRKLMERIAAKSGKSNSSATQTGNNSTAGESKSTSQTEALRAQLAALEAEAQSLGIDPSMPEDASWGGRGRGRGRGGYRGRGAFVPRGTRGGYRGRGGAPFTGGNAYKLDNRPKKIALTGIDLSNPDKDESLRQYLLGIGEFTDIETTPERTSITFKDRFTAEKFMYGTPGCDIPSVGKVDMTWVQTPLPPVNLAAKAAKVDIDHDTAMDEGDAMAAPSSPQGHAGYGKEVQDNLDYDVAGDDDWGIQ